MERKVSIGREGRRKEKGGEKEVEKKGRGVRKVFFEVEMRMRWMRKRNFFAYLDHVVDSEV